MYESRGRLVYDPAAIKGKKKSPQPWWLIVECSEDLINYYRWLMLRATGIKLAKPAWGAHITVIRGEKPPDETVWAKYQGESVSFLYSSALCTDEKYWWLDVEAPFVLDIREECGLPRQPQIPLHLTVGLLLAGY